jgi:hypothetical protein
MYSLPLLHFFFLIFHTCIHTSKETLQDLKQAKKKQENTEGSTAASRHLQPQGTPPRATSIAGDDEDHHPEPSHRERKNS